MPISAAKIDERVADVRVSADALEVRLQDGRQVAAPLAWFPRLAAASAEARAHWEISAGGYGVHWPEIDEDVGVAGLLRSKGRST
jgi:hypothetical protein